MMKVLPFLLGTVISATGSFANNELLYDNVSREIGESVPAHSLTYSPQTSPARVEGQSVEFSYCQDPETAYNLSSRGMTKDTYLWIAFEIPVEEQQAYLGNQISAVNFMTGTTSGYTWPTGLEYMIYVTDDLSVLPTFDRMLSQNVAFNYNTCNLKTPFTITGEKPVYVGYRIKLKNASQASSLYVLPVDGIPTDNKSTLYYMTTDKTAVPVFKSSRGVYQNWAPEMGSVCLQALVTGDNLPKALAKPTGITMTNYFNTSTKLKYELDVKNFGTEPISSLVVRSVVDNGTNYDRTVTVSPAIESGAVGTVTVQNVPNAAVGQYTLSSTILKVNGVDVPTEMQKTVTAEYSCYDNGWARQIVIEEGTGVKCSWCPRGIVMMEYIKEHYPDWIRIAVHGAFGLDPMTADTYVPMIYDYLPGAPTAVANRYAEVTVGGADDQYYAPVNEFFTSFPAYADVTFSAQCSDDDSKVKVVATSEFEFTPSVEHRLAFALVEDNVGPYDQANAYAGGGSGAMGGWEKKGSSVPTMYEDVARYLDGYPGIEGSLPATINPHTPYTFEREIPITSVTNGKFRIVAMIVNVKSGEIVNAREITVYKSGVKGIENDAQPAIEINDGTISADGANVAVYTLDGRRVNNSGLAKGVYIVSVDGRSRKVLVK